VKHYQARVRQQALITIAVINIVGLTLINSSPAAHAALLAQNPTLDTSSFIREQADQLEKEARDLYIRGDRQAALEKLNQLLLLYRQIGDRAGEGRMLSNIGTIHRSLGQYPQALEAQQQALTIARETGDRPSEGVILGNIGTIYDRQGQYFQALEFLEQSLAIARELNIREGETQALTGIGFIHSYLGQYSQALEFLQQALVIAQELGELREQGIILSGMGIVYESKGQYAEALRSYQRAASLAREIGDREGEASTLNNIGLVYQDVGQYSNALESLLEALEINQEIGNSDGEGASLNNIGLIHYRQRDYPQALEFFQQALTVQQKIGDQSSAGITLNNIGMIYSEQGNNSQALEILSQAITIRREVGDQAGQGQSLNNLGRLYIEMGKISEAMEFFQQALSLTRIIGDRSLEATILTNMGFLYEQLADTTQAITFHQQSIDVTESIQDDIKIEELQASFANQEIDVYERLIGLLWNQGKIENAFNYVERARARAFLNQIAAGRINIRAGVESRLLEQEQILKSQIIALRNQLINLKNRPQNQWDSEAIANIERQLSDREKDFENLLIEIKIQSPEIASLVSIDVAPIAEIQSNLTPDTTLVEYFVTGDRTFAFIITRNSFNAVPIEVTQAELAEQIQLFRDFANLDDAHPAELQQLHQWLIAPLKPYLTTNNLIIVPHGVLHYLPFAALTDGSRYLNDDYVISLLPSANTLRYLPQHHNSPATTLLALGNPTISGNLSPLRYAQSEVEAIAPLFNTEALVGSTATESAIRSNGGRANILHLAVHGEYNPINPLFSTLHLASDTQQDGRLEVHEIYGLDLTAATNLVVLSACQTNIGELSRGDEVVGLNRAFLYAGTPAVMSSLWNVDDAATEMLMEQFYTHFRTGMSETEALQQAQQAVRAEHPHPYFWAAFSITGNTRR